MAVILQMPGKWPPFLSSGANHDSFGFERRSGIFIVNFELLRFHTLLWFFYYQV